MSAEAAEVVVVGSANTDLIAYVPRLPRKGETVHVSARWSLSVCVSVCLCVYLIVSV